MERTSKIEETLEHLYVHTQEMHEDHIKADDLVSIDKSSLEEMTIQNLIVIEKGYVRLTAVGMDEGRDVVRRHRLAELLLTEVLEINDDDLVNDTACAFEHLLIKGLDAVIPLTSLKPEQRGKIAYLRTKESKELQKLMAMGLLPGTPIHLIRSFPSYVFRLGYTQFAIDKQIAHEIFVRLTN
jgi:DtxR family Mn-dependent transcriptional regulator